MPVVGDRVICLRNNHKKQIFNGMLGTVNQIFDVTERYIEIEIAMDYEDKKYRGRVLTSQFKNNNSVNYTADRSITNGIDLFDFGYALTVHKAQGSQARKVILFEERFSKMTDTQWARWLYTGVTRAEEELIIFGR
jgi:exodeoxyribonuclease-5